MEPEKQRQRKLWGRSLSRPLSPTQKDLFDKSMDTFSYTHHHIDFFQKYNAFVLEIGFGDGEHLLGMALENPTMGFIGCERFINGVANLFKGIEEHQLKNIRVFNDDVHFLIEDLPKNKLERIFVLFPDPWPKKKHHKRRLLTKEFMGLCHTLLAPGGKLCMASDIEDYRNFIQEEAAQVQDLFVLRETISAPMTKYCRKAEKAGRHSLMSIYEKKE